MTEAERNQARALHHRQVRGEALDETERALVQTFLKTVSDEDATRRVVSDQQMDALLAAKEERNHKLADLLQRQQRVVESLRAALIQAEVERREIARERQIIESAPL